MTERVRISNEHLHSNTAAAVFGMLIALLDRDYHGELEIDTELLYNIGNPSLEYEVVGGILRLYVVHPEVIEAEETEEEVEEDAE